ncbi:MAG TPA: MOSC domain-containing protein [Acidimicrobiales bacterium]
MITVLGDTYTHDDARATIGAVAVWWDMLTAERYARSVYELGWEMAEALAHAAAEPTPLGEGDPSPTLHELVPRARTRFMGEWSGDDDLAATALVEHLITALRQTADGLRAAGQMPPTAQGSVHGLFVSDGGVPKHTRNRVDVGWRGLAGDRQATRKHHGRPWQALCLYSYEQVRAFQAEGHPIAPGSAGENISISGLPWADVRPGVRLRIGEVLAEVTTYSPPCKNNAQWFADGDFNHLNHERGAFSRVYASVLRPGTVSVGDPVVLEPDS